MRENRLHGSEGGEVMSLPYPYPGFSPVPAFFSFMNDYFQFHDGYLTLFRDDEITDVGQR